MPRWESRVGEHLRDDESITDVVDTGSDEVVVTSDRLLVLPSPASTGDDVQTARLSTVTDVSPGTSGNRGYLHTGTILAIFGALFLVGGTILNVENYLPGPESLDLDGAERIGGGDAVDLMQTVLWLLVRLDEGMQFLGVVLILLGIVAVTVYLLYERTPTIEIRVSGNGENLSIPRPADGDAVLRRLQRALAMETGTNNDSATDDSSSSDSGFVADTE